MVTFPRVLNVYNSGPCGNCWWISYCRKLFRTWRKVVSVVLALSLWKFHWCYFMQERNTTFLCTILNKTLIKSIQAAKVAALQVDFHPESCFHLIFFFPFLITWALTEKENMVFPVREKCQGVFSHVCASV